MYSEIFSQLDWVWVCLSIHAAFRFKEQKMNRPCQSTPSSPAYALHFGMWPQNARGQPVSLFEWKATQLTLVERRWDRLCWFWSKKILNGTVHHHHALHASLATCSSKKMPHACVANIPQLHTFWSLASGNACTLPVAVPSLLVVLALTRWVLLRSFRLISTCSLVTVFDRGRLEEEGERSFSAASSRARVWTCCGLRHAVRQARHVQCEQLVDGRTTAEGEDALHRAPSRRPPARTDISREWSCVFLFVLSLRCERARALLLLVTGFAWGWGTGVCVRVCPERSGVNACTLDWRCTFVLDVWLIWHDCGVRRVNATSPSPRSPLNRRV